MQSLMQKFRQSSLLFSRNQLFCLKNWKLSRAPTTIEFNIFCWNFPELSYLPMSTKECSGFFYFNLELLAEIKKHLASTHSRKPGLSITQNLN